jgi:hypothetical protein
MVLPIEEKVPTPASVVTRLTKPKTLMAGLVVPAIHVGVRSVALQIKRARLRQDASSSEADEPRYGVDGRDKARP